MSGEIIKGGSFLVEAVEPKNVFTPEDFTDEHKMIADTAASFVEGEVEPVIDDLEAQKDNLMRELLVKAGELGLLGADVPEEYGGMELDKISSMLITENIIKGGSFSLGHGFPLAMAPIQVSDHYLSYFLVTSSRRKNTCLDWQVVRNWLLMH